MKILLLSVLAVAMIGVIIPSAFAEIVYESLSCCPIHDSAKFFFKDWQFSNYEKTKIKIYVEVDALSESGAFINPDSIVLVDNVGIVYENDHSYPNYYESFFIEKSTTLFDSEKRNFYVFFEIGSDFKNHELLMIYFQDERKLIDSSVRIDHNDNSFVKIGDLSELSMTTPYENSPAGGGCLIATATYGSEMAPQVQFLREIRDNTVLQTQSGISFMTGFNQFYYSFSPQIADYERENPVFKETVKVTLTPLLTSLTLLNYVEIDSEEEMLGYGIGIILLNVGMYFVAPAVLIISLKKKLKK